MSSKHLRKDPSFLRHRRRVVIIDASRSLSDLLGFLLAHEGHEAQTATDGPTAVELIRTFEPDVVVSSIVLPGGLDGFEVASQIQRCLSKKPLLIAHTSYSKREISERARAAGFDLYLPKPCSFEDLLRAVEFVSDAADCEDLQL